MDSDRECMDVDIVCVGFGPAAGGFLTKLAEAMSEECDGVPVLQSRVAEGMPLQVMCYERADDIGFGVSGVATRAKAIRESLPNLDPSEIPMAHPITDEKMLFLLDPVGASRRPASLRLAGKLASKLLHCEEQAVALPFIPKFLRKDDGLLFSIGQLNQWVGSQLMATGMVQVWPAMPVSEPLIDDDRVVGVRLCDQGTDKHGKPADGYMPGMDVRAALTVVADGPLGPVGQKLDEHFGLPEGYQAEQWAVGVKMVVDLPENCPLEAGTVLHTFGYPEPEIFGYLYVYPEGVASLGIFVPSWWDSPIRTGYRYLQHWMMHPYLYRYLEGGSMRSWGAKTLRESGRRGEPKLVGDGYARIGEGSGSTNILTNSGVDEAWATGVQLAEGVIELLRDEKPFSAEQLQRTYVARRRASWLEQEARVAERARDGFEHSFMRGMIGMGLSGLTSGKLNLSGRSRGREVQSFAEYFAGRIDVDELESIRAKAKAAGASLHDELMSRSGWPEIPYDGQLLVSHQDALLLGGKVQAPPGYADHIVMVDPAKCTHCEAALCVEMCSGQALSLAEDADGGVAFDREKCIHCGACVWSCSQAREDDPTRGNIELRAGAGGLHSAEN